jgi:hypothetical protein
MHALRKNGTGRRTQNLEVAGSSFQIITLSVIQNRRASAGEEPALGVFASGCHAERSRSIPTHFSAACANLPRILPHPHPWPRQRKHRSPTHHSLQGRLKVFHLIVRANGNPDASGPYRPNPTDVNILPDHGIDELIARPLYIKHETIRFGWNV